MKTEKEIREAAHKAMDAYLDAGGDPEFIITSQRDFDRNYQTSITKENNKAKADMIDAFLKLIGEDYASHIHNISAYQNKLRGALEDLRGTI